MHSAENKAPDAPTSSSTSKKANISKDDEDDLAAINATVDRMQGITLPDPYILTIPQDLEPKYVYRHSYRYQETQWLDHTPFRRNEGEKIQYLTFHYHEHGRDMFVLHNSRLIDNPEEEATKQKPKAAEASGGPKKKLTLGDYKKKQTGTPIPDKVREKKEAGTPLKQSTSSSDEQGSQLKRKREQQHQDINSANEDRPVNKRPRNATPPARSPQRNGKASGKPTTPFSEAGDMPPKLSPLRDSERDRDALPSRLSPTIPANIRASLKALQQSRSSDVSAPHSTSKNDQSARKKLDSSAKQKSPVSRNDRVSSSSPEPALKDEIAVRNVAQATKASTTRLIVKLEYKKSLRGDVRRILGTRPQPKVPSKTSDRETPDRRQRPTSDEMADERSNKPKKHVPESLKLKEPTTPLHPDLNSPTALTSAQKNQQVTPSFRKDHLSAAKREGHANSLTNSPTAESGTPTIGTSTSQPNGAARRPSSQPSSKTSLQNSWEHEQKRFDALGRELKHASTACLKEAMAEPSKAKSSQKLGAVKAVESLITYILAFTCSDHSALAASPRQNPSIQPWRSLKGYDKFVQKNCEPFPSLVGLSCWLSVVFYAHILDISSQLPAEGPSRDTLLEFQAMVQRSANHGEAKLDLDKLMETFPKTWKKRSQGMVSSNIDSPSKLAGKFKLPIGVQTPPVHAARAGYAMLEEWIAKEGVNYTLKLKF